MTKCDVDNCRKPAAWGGNWEAPNSPAHGQWWNWCDDCYTAEPGFRMEMTKNIQVLDS